MCFLTQAEFDGMLLEFAGEGIPLLVAAVPADSFFPYLNDLLPLIMSKAVSLGASACIHTDILVLSGDQKNLSS